MNENGIIIKEKYVEVIKSFANNNMNIASTARELHCTVGFVTYYLDRIKEDMGHDPYRFWDLIEIVNLIGIEP